MDVQLEFQLGYPGGRGGRRKDCPGTVAYRDSAQNALTFLFGQGLHDCRSYSGFSSLDFLPTSSEGCKNDIDQIFH